ncbi:MAG: IS630 family transposase, partial [Candidatus Thiodiazotropha sp.]
GNLPYGLISLMASKYSVSKSTVHKLWRQYHSTGNLREKPHSGGNKLKLSDEDIEYVQALKREKPSMTLKSIQSKLLENANRDVSLNTISKTIRHRLPHGNWSYKVMSRPAGDRFSDRNLQYTHAFIDVIRNRDPVRIKFMDEAGFCLPDAASATRGHAPVGQRCVEIQDIKKSQNLTLNLLIGIEGVLYINFVHGASNTAEFLNFFDEAARAYTDSGTPVLSPGDIVVVDNAAIHRHEAERILGTFFQNIGIELIYLPTYSPDMNPAEFAFNHIRTQLRTPPYSDIAKENLEFAIMKSTDTITSSNADGFYRKVGYLNFV